MEGNVQKVIVILDDNTLKDSELIEKAINLVMSRTKMQNIDKKPLDTLGMFYGYIDKEKIPLLESIKGINSVEPIYKRYAV